MPRQSEVRLHQGDSETHASAPYRYRKTAEEVTAVVMRIFSEMSRTELVQEEDVYLHYEVTSLLLRFVDDVEILFDDVSKTIHFRSAAGGSATTVVASTVGKWRI